MKKLVTTVAVITGILAPGICMTGVAFADPAPCPPGWIGKEIGCVKLLPGNGGGNSGSGFNVKPYSVSGG